MTDRGSNVGVVLLLVLGTFAGSTSVIFFKASSLDPVVLACLRLLTAVIALAPLFVRDWLRHCARYGQKDLGRALIPGAVLSLHFVTWIAGARMTPAVNSSLIVNMVPLVSPLLLLLVAREAITRHEWLGTVVSLGGIFLLASADYRFNPEFFQGDMVCFGSMVLFALYLVLGRRNRDFPSIWLYVVPLYATASACCFVISLFRVTPFDESYPPREIAMVLGLGLVPTVIGHSIFNLAMKHLRGQVVSTANLAQPIFAGVLAFALLDEVPTWTFYPACVLIVLGVLIAFRPKPLRGAESG